MRRLAALTCSRTNSAQHLFRDGPSTISRSVRAPPIVRPFATSSASASSPSPSIPPMVASLPYDKYPHRDPGMQVDHLVIGGGVVGLAIAAQLAKRYPDKSTFLVERHRQAGQETSSRNSEVIHAGLYYPPHSLKTMLCTRGREAMYRRCSEWNVPFKNTGKLVVGPEKSKEYFEKIIHHIEALPSSSLPPPVKLLSGAEAKELEPDLGPEVAWALHSERTGIVSSHELMESLEREIMDSENAELVYDTKVVRVDPAEPNRKGEVESGKRGLDQSEEGWIVQTVTHSEEQNGESDAILARVVINSAGLNGHLALNALHAQERFEQGSEPMGMWYCKGNYVSYKGPGVGNVKRLIYPVPDMSGGLGTHLTIDLSGNIRFGPDTEWLSPPSKESAVDFWSKRLAPVTTEERLQQMYSSITSYLPDISLEGLAPDYAGIRPKLIPPGAGFMDFTLLWHWSRDLSSQKLWSYAHLPKDFSAASQGGADTNGGHHGRLADRNGKGGAMLTLAGIESPGLTSSLSLADMVADMVTEQVWGHGDAISQAKIKRDQERASKSHENAKSSISKGSSVDKVIPRGARNEEVGGATLDAWA